MESPLGKGQSALDDAERVRKQQFRSTSSALGKLSYQRSKNEGKVALAKSSDPPVSCCALGTVMVIVGDVRVCAHAALFLRLLM